MRLLIIAGRVSMQPWTHGATTIRIVRGLAARGHDVTLACDAAEDTAGLASVCRVVARTSFRMGASRYPGAFPRWAARIARGSTHDIVLSLTHRFGGQVWMPIDESARSWFAHVLATRSPIGIGAAAARNLGFITDLLAVHPRGPRAQRVIVVSGPAAEAAREFRGGQLAQAVMAALVTSTLALPEPIRVAELRTRTRAMLGIAPGRLVVLVSLIQSFGRYLDGPMSAIRSLNVRSAARDHNDGPVLVVLTNEPYRAHAAAIRTGCEVHARILGVTSDVSPLLAACDVAATCVPLAHGAFEAGNTARFTADAIRFGRPVLALAESSGVAGLGVGTPDDHVPGLVIASPSALEWERAIRQASDPAWLGAASESARRIAPQLDSDRLIDVVESAITTAHAAKA